MVALGAVLLGFVGCFLDSLSLAVWRLCALPLYDNTRVILLGYALQFSCMIVDVLSLMFLTEFTHSVVDAFSVISILLVSRYVLGEVASNTEVAGALCVVAGIVICVGARPDAPEDLNYARALAGFEQTWTVVWFFALSATSISLCYALHPFRLYRSVAVAAGLLGALSETLAKSMTLAAYEARWDEWAVFIGIIAVYVLSEMYVIRLSLSVNPTYRHQPVFYATWALNGMLSGGLVYGDFEVYRENYLALALTIIGVGLLLFGCVVPLLDISRAEQKLSASAVSPAFRHLATANPLYEEEAQEFTKTI